jgi:dolichol-phosphate mannosyltransferase
VKVLVGIPAYNCEKQIGRVLGGFDEALLARLDKVIVIINQGAKDNTVRAAKEAAATFGSSKIEVWENNGNYSLGGSHKVAFLEAERLGCDYTAILHGDDQATTSELNLLLDEAEKDPSLDAVLGTRFMPGSRLQGYDWKRIMGNRVLNLAYTALIGKRVRDLGSGLNLFKMSALKDHHYLGFADALTFNFDLLLDFYRKRSRLKYLPITWKEEDQTTNARNFKIAQAAGESLLKWRFGMLKYPIRTPGQYSSRKVS